MVALHLCERSLPSCRNAPRLKLALLGHNQRLRFRSLMPLARRLRSKLLLGYLELTLILHTVSFFYSDTLHRVVRLRFAFRVSDIISRSQSLNSLSSALADSYQLTAGDPRGSVYFLHISTCTRRKFMSCLASVAFVVTWRYTGHWSSELVAIGWMDVADEYLSNCCRWMMDGWVDIPAGITLVHRESEQSWID